MLPEPDEEVPWIPRADVFVTSSGEFVIKVELASMRRENLELSMEGQQLCIVGQRPDPDREDPGSKYLQDEIRHGPFRLVVETPADFDPALAKAVYQNGSLRVTVPPRHFGRFIGHD